MSEYSSNGVTVKSRSDLLLEVVVISVSDVDQSKRFYSALGWRLDTDSVLSEQVRIVQFTPPGSSCSIHFGKGLALTKSGCSQSMYLVTSNIENARQELIQRGVKVGEIFHKLAEVRVPGPESQRRSYGSFASFVDPDGNEWLLQEITVRLPGHFDPAPTNNVSALDLAAALRRAAAAHVEHEKQLGHADANWPDWYALFLVAERQSAN